VRGTQRRADLDRVPEGALDLDRKRGQPHGIALEARDGLDHDLAAGESLQERGRGGERRLPERRAPGDDAAADVDDLRELVEPLKDRCPCRGDHLVKVDLQRVGPVAIQRGGGFRLRERDEGRVDLRRHGAPEPPVRAANGHGEDHRDRPGVPEREARLQRERHHPGSSLTRYPRPRTV
jgi:hypothetical protein